MPIQEPGQQDLGRTAELMKSLRSGNKEAAGQLVAAFYPELRKDGGSPDAKRADAAHVAAYRPGE